MVDRGWPHQVALPASASLNGGYQAIHEFCKTLSLCPRGHAVFHEGEWLNVYCFAVAADAKTKVPLHVHKGDAVCRYILDGSFTLNGTKYEAGEWVIVPKDKPYEIATEEGYHAVVAYCGSQACQ